MSEAVATASQTPELTIEKNGDDEVAVLGNLRSDNTTDVRMVRERIRLAVKGIAPVSPEFHNKMLRFLESVFDQKRSALRTKFAAAQGGALFERLDIEREKLEIQREKLEIERQKLNLPSQPQIHLHAHKHEAITIEEDERWYGNDAHNSIAETAPPPTADPVGPGTIQGGGVRPAVGQDSNGIADGDTRSWPDPLDDEGCN